jgi:hypothetical protein
MHKRHAWPACDEDFGSVYMLLFHGRTRLGRMYHGIHTPRLLVEQEAIKWMSVNGIVCPQSTDSAHGGLPAERLLPERVK